MKMTDKYPFRFNATDLITALGGAREVHRILSEAKSDIRHKTVQKWMERESIPPEALATLVATARASGMPFVLENYLEETSR